MSTKSYDLVKNLPVARFYYKGQSHSHPVRRTILVVESSASILVGYELREGSDVRAFSKAPIKSFRRDKIAKFNQCGTRMRTRTDKLKMTDTTLIRSDLLDLVKKGA